MAKIESDSDFSGWLWGEWQDEQGRWHCQPLPGDLLTEYYGDGDWGEPLNYPELDDLYNEYLDAGEGSPVCWCEDLPCLTCTGCKAVNLRRLAWLASPKAPVIDSYGHLQPRWHPVTAPATWWASDEVLIDCHDILTLDTGVADNPRVLDLLADVLDRNRITTSPSAMYHEVTETIDGWRGWADAITEAKIPDEVFLLIPENAT